MFKIRYIIRSLLRNRTNTLINIVGLSFGIATVLLLILYIQHELGYDKQFSDYKNIYRITTQFISPDNIQHIAIAPLPLKHILKENYPEIEETGVVLELPEQYVVEYNNIKFMQDGFRDASPNIFKILDYKIIKGDLKTALTDPNSVVLTESLARKIMGQNLEINKEILIDKAPCNITAIIEDLPKNMDLQFTALFPGYQDNVTDLLEFDGFLFVKLKQGTSKDINQILNQIEAEHYIPLKEQMDGLEIKFHAQRIDEIHFTKEILADSPKGNIQHVYFFTIVAFIILLVACINYINLSFARLSERNYFTGVCKINGASKFQSNLFLLIESILITSASLIIAIILVLLFLPILNFITNKDILASSIFSYRFLATILVVFVSIIFVVNGLPIILSLFIRRNNDIQELIKKGTNKSGNYRSGLVVAQFAFTIALIICLIAFQHQMKFMKNKDLGFQPENVITIQSPLQSENHHLINQFVDLIKKHPTIEKISNTAGAAQPGNFMTGGKMIHNAEINGEIKQFIVSLCDVDENYFELLRIPVIKGENFSNIPNTNINKCIINESYAKALCIENNPIGKIINEGNDEVIGVVKDFHFLSPHNPIEPMCFSYYQGYPGEIFVRSDLDILPQLKAVWKKTIPQYPFPYSYLENIYDRQYLKDDNLFKIVMFFTVLSILISCMGVVGLIKYTCEKRLKEIGVRKVFGAKPKEIISMINIEFLRWVVLAFLISSPIASLIINKWYENYAYHTDIGGGIFALSGISILILSLAMVSWLTWYWANRNPVEALRYE